MFRGYTVRARKAMALANQEGQRLNHEYTGTEHLLLGLVKEGSGVAAMALDKLGVDLAVARAEVEKLVKPGPDMVTMDKLPKTARLDKALKYARTEAKTLHQNLVGTEHLLLGLLVESEGVGAQILRNLGLTLEKVRPEVLRLLGMESDGDSTPAETESAALPDDDEKAREWVNQMIVRAVEARASDIHLDSTEDRRGRVRFRIDGVLQDSDRPPGGLYEEIVARIKVMADMDVGETRLPQDGQIKVSVNRAELDLRVCAVPAFYGERIVLRVLGGDAVALSLDHMGLLDEDKATLRRLCRLPNGIIVCSGPTSSGKTTLLYSMLLEVDRDKCCVMTVEDPVEYSFSGMGQIQVDARRGLTFPRAIRHILRQDPDVIMVGELRDLETLELCVQASLTGHLVLTTLHAATSPGALKRMLDMGLPPFLVNDTTAAVISQRLVRVFCPECKGPATPSEHSMRPEAVEFISARPDAQFHAAAGCEHCRGTGYRGRTAIHEILVMDEAVRQVVARPCDAASLRQAAIRAGMTPMLHNGLEKAAQGVTSVEEVLRVVPVGPNV